MMPRMTPRMTPRMMCQLSSGYSRRQGYRSRLPAKPYMAHGTDTLISTSCVLGVCMACKPRVIRGAKTRTSTCGQRCKDMFIACWYSRWGNQLLGWRWRCGCALVKFLVLRGSCVSVNWTSCWFCRRRMEGGQRDTFAGREAQVLILGIGA